MPAQAARGSWFDRLTMSRLEWLELDFKKALRAVRTIAKFIPGVIVV